MTDYDTKQHKHLDSITCTRCRIPDRTPESEESEVRQSNAPIADRDIRKEVRYSYLLRDAAEHAYHESKLHEKIKEGALTEQEVAQLSTRQRPIR